MVHEELEMSANEHHKRRVQVVFTRTMEERRVFMEELKSVRKQREKRVMKLIRTEIGPKWYHALSVSQRRALDTLQFSIYQDLLEGRPSRTSKIIRQLGIYPRPKKIDLLNCVYEGRNDHKLMLAHLFYITYHFHFDEIVESYCLNAKLMLSALYYLGLNDMIMWLREKFRPDPVETRPKLKPKLKVESPLKSPYLQKLVAALYVPPQHKRLPPPPLPANLDDLNEQHFEERPVPPKPEPPPPPPPPPKRRLPISYCDKLAGVTKMIPFQPIAELPKASSNSSNKKSKASKLASKLLLQDTKNTFGMSSTHRDKKKKKPVAPSTGMWNAPYHIVGVYTIHGRSVFVLGSVTKLTSNGDMIHGGHKYLMNGDFINIHGGYRAKPPPTPPPPCDCVKKYQDSVLDYVKSTKCRCGHYYDFGNEGTFPPDEPPYFTKPNRAGTAPLSFNYSTIYEMHPQLIHVEKEFKRAFDADSVLGEGGPLPAKKKKKRRSSTTCLGEYPQPKDYLKCALRILGCHNIAARLPNVYLAPELKEWMRKRIYGPLNRAQRRELLIKSGVYWTILKDVESKGLGHVYPAHDPNYTGYSTWKFKEALHKKFKLFTREHKLRMFRVYAELNDLLWATMFQAQLPDKNFRQIYFSYLSSRLEDLQFMHPYSTRQAMDRMEVMYKKRYCCLPPGVHPEDE